MKFKIEVCKTKLKIILLEIVDDEGIKIEYCNKINPAELDQVEYPLLKPEILLVKMCTDPIALSGVIAHYARFVPAIAITDAYFKRAVIVHSINSTYARGTYLPLAEWGLVTLRFVKTKAKV